jgi:diacylglycerol kinase family enzyme
MKDPAILDVTPLRSDPVPGDAVLPVPARGLRVAVVINAKAGAARASDRRTLEERITAAVAGIGTVSQITFVEPRHWRSTLTGLAARSDLDAVIVGGGDGSISTAGSIFVGTGKAMGVIPLGTFNLFARSLRIPIGFEAALAALEDSVVEPLDVGVLTDGKGDSHTFLHHVSLGFHPRFIETRDAIPYASRFGKMLASLRVWRQTLTSLRRLTLTVSGDITRPRAHYYQVAVTVGSFREGLIDFPHAEDLTKGDLDIVLVAASSTRDFLIAALLAAIGRWRTNPMLEVEALRHVVLDGPDRKVAVSCDGEVTRRRLPLDFRVRPKALLVIHPVTPTA